jgi:hypothetical protein
MTLAQTLEAIDKLHRAAREIERALRQHAAAERDPVAHARLHRLHRVVHDFALAMMALPTRPICARQSVACEAERITNDFQKEENHET